MNAKPRGDAVAVPMLHGGRHVGTAWRRPYVIHEQGRRREFVRFDGGWFLLEAGEVTSGQIVLDEMSFRDFAERPKRFNVTDIKL